MNKDHPNVLLNEHTPAAHPTAKRQPHLAVASVLATGLVLGALILRSGGSHDSTDGHGHEPDGAAAVASASSAAAEAVSAASAAASAPGSAPASAPSASTPKLDLLNERVPFSDAQLVRSGVQLHFVGPVPLRSSTPVMGEVKLNADRSVVLVPRLAGVVMSVHANAGDRVQRGQLLAVLSSPALADSRAELLAAQKRLVLMQRQYEREQSLFNARISAEQDYLAARQAFEEAQIEVERRRQVLAALGASASGPAQDLARYELRAPIAGVVTDKQLAVGAALKDDAAVFQIADLSSVWVELQLPAAELGRLREGAEALVQAPGLQARARISHIGTLLGEQSRSARARLVLPNPKLQWRPGMPVDVRVLGEAHPVALAVPQDAIQTVNEQTVVFVRDGQRFEPRPVRIGHSDGQWVEVLSGLKPGEQVAGRNSYVVKAEQGKSEAEHDH